MEQKTEISREHKEIRGLAKTIAKDRIAPNALERDLNQTFPWDCIRILGETGFLGIVVSEDLGGFGVGRKFFASVIEEISTACASTALVLVSHAIVAKALELAADEAVAKRWLPEMVKGKSLGAFAVHEPDSGSNAGAITTRAIKDGDH
jgi:alkylation response protein AidB-like acyl-CoA dehydrogenase